MAWRFNKSVTLKMSRAEAREVWAALDFYQGHGLDEGGEVKAVIDRMTLQTEQRRASAPSPDTKES
jgi:hypothetical protein